MTNSDTLFVILAILGLMASIFIIMIPYLIAKKRNHAYANIILVLSVLIFIGIIPWVIALIWALFPSDKSLIDPIIGNPTGIGRRNAGDTIGNVQYGKERGYEEEKINSKSSTTDYLNRKDPF